MSIMGRKVPVKVVAVLALCMVVGALIPALSSTAPAREIPLVVRDMAFYLESDLQTPNPTIEVRAGETVRVVVRNQERGMMHDFAVPSLRGANLDLIGFDTSRSVTITLPSQPGTYEYVCRPHRMMMRGLIHVVAD